MAKKVAPKGEKKPDTTLIRVTVEFAEMIRDAASFEKTSIADFATEHLTPVVSKRFRDAVLKTAKRLEGDK